MLILGVMTTSSYLVIALVSGIAGAALVQPSRPIVLLVTFVITVCYALVVLFVRRRRYLLCGGAAVLCMQSLGWVLGSSESWSRLAYKEADHVVVGQVVGARKGASQRWWLTVEAREAAVVPKDERALTYRKTSFRTLVAVDEEVARALGGRERVLLRVRGLSQREGHNFGDSGVRRRPPAFANLAAGPLLLDEGDLWERGLRQLRRTLSRGLDRTLNGQERALAKALVIGDRNDLDETTIAAFRHTGAAHLLAVSGLHVSLIGQLCFLLVYGVLIRLPCAERMRVALPASLLAILVCWAYAMLTGLAPPAHRAAIMATAAFGARVVGRPAQSGRALWIAAAVILAGEPDLIWSPGFQLSFAAVATLVGLSHDGEAAKAEASTPLAKIIDVLRKPLMRSLVACTAATAATTPLIAHHFGLFSPWSVAVNLIAVPCMGIFVLPATMVLTFAAAVSPALGAVVALPTSFGLSLLIEGLRWASELPASAVAAPRPPLIAAALASLAAVSLFRGSRAARIVASALLVTGLAIWLIGSAGLERRGRLSVTFLDVGAGDATIIDFPNGDRMLVDAGPQEGSLSRQPPPLRALQRSGGGRLSIFALTHHHADHAAGAKAVMSTVGAARLWRPLPGAGDPEHPLVTSARARGTAVIDVESLCGVLKVGGVRLAVLHPCSSDAAGLSENDRSLVFRLDHGETSFLFPGDIEAETESALVEIGSLEPVTVLKLPHHGSATSSTEGFLDALQPSLAIASCGRSRSRPLPAPLVAERLRQRGIHTLSTAELGAIRVVSNGRELSVASARLGELRFANTSRAR